jgi:hypothetical protein
MEVVAIIVIGGLLARFLGSGKSGGGSRSSSSYTPPSYKTKANDDEMRHQHLVREQENARRAAEDARRKNY